MSGTGKSSVFVELARRGHRVVDTDHGAWIEEAPSTDGRPFEPLWREDRIDALLAAHDDSSLFISGTVANQGRFYPRFDAVVLLSAPADVIIDRVARRDANEYGRTDGERQFILEDLATVEPLLRVGATAEIDTQAPVSAVADELERIAKTARRR
jgi:hypothetical protein